MVKQRFSSADVAAEAACLRQRCLGMRVANVYDINPKVGGWAVVDRALSIRVPAAGVRCQPAAIKHHTCPTLPCLALPSCPPADIRAEAGSQW
jgi:hypothetical protein